MKSLQNKLSKTESAIQQLEKEIKELDFELSVNYEETIAKPNFFEAYQGKKAQLDQLMEAWETITHEMESIG